IAVEHLRVRWVTSWTAHPRPCRSLQGHGAGCLPRGRPTTVAQHFRRKWDSITSSALPQHFPPQDPSALAVIAERSTPSRLRAADDLCVAALCAAPHGGRSPTSYGPQIGRIADVLSAAAAQAAPGPHPSVPAPSPRIYGSRQ